MSTAKKTSTDKDLQRVLTPTFRVSYPHVFKPSVMKGTQNAPKYSITMLFPKETDLSVIKLAIKHAKIAKFGPNSKEWPALSGSPVTDGDLPNSKGEIPEGYAGHWVIKASCKEDQKPGVVDYPACDDIMDQGDFYAGCFARAYVYAYVWEFPQGSGKYGVSFILDHVQKMKDGPSFGGKKSAKDVFAPPALGEDEQAEDTEDFT